ncbi:MAG: right-handed parallel beta-helix repeat-containing protein, partial [Methanoregulaceae archaeon]|nr:right-handed parallel beta-helix repeat-containing protein [Methanoregulaceae archaeon]
MFHDSCRLMVVISFMLMCVTCCIPVNAEDPYVISSLPFEINESAVSDLGTHQFLLGTDWTGTASDPGAILITANDVILDGGSHILSGTLDSDPDTGQTGILVTADNVTVRNVEVNGWDGGIFYYQSSDGVISDTLADRNVNAGIGLFECTQITLDNNRAGGSVAGDGINVVNSTRVWLDNNDATGNAHNGIAFNDVFQGGIIGGNLSDNNDNGIGIWQDSRNISIGRNYIARIVNGCGINIDGGEYIDLFDNQVSGTPQGIGIAYGHASNGGIVNNTVTGARDAGIGLVGCAQIGVNENHVTGTSGGDGIAVIDSTRIWLGYNEATGNAHNGVSFSNVFEGGITGGDFPDNNDNGIGIWQNSRNISVGGNTVSGTVNGTGINVDGGENIGIFDNRVSGIAQGPGIIYGHASNGSIVNNTVTGPRDVGIGLVGCTEIGINDNHATGSSGGDGIAVGDSTRIWLGNNEATGNAHNGVSFSNIFEGG